MWKFIFGFIVGTVVTVIGAVLFTALAVYSAFDTDRLSERNKRR
jgi:uncharacterized membrane protein YdjX (TVP38/TMEM64 family)